MFREQIVKMIDISKLVHLVANRKKLVAKQTDKAALLPRPGLSCNKRSGPAAF